MGFQVVGQDLSRCTYSLSKGLESLREKDSRLHSNWVACGCNDVNHSEMFSHAKDIVYREIYHFCIYRYLVCLYCSEDGTLWKCSTDSIPLDRNPPPSKETVICRQAKILPTVRSELIINSKKSSVISG